MHETAISGLVALSITWLALSATRGRTHPLRGAPSSAAHPNPQPVGINYAGNPYRVGAYVYVMEANSPSELDWQGTYLGMQDGYALIRDAETLMVASVNKDQLYSAQR